MSRFKAYGFLLIVSLVIATLTACKDSNALGGLANMLSNDEMRVVVYNPEQARKWANDNKADASAALYVLRSNRNDVKSMGLMIRSLGLLKTPDSVEEDKKDQKTE